MKTMKTLFAGLLCTVLMAFTASAQELEKWSAAYPSASKNLGYWVKERPEAAHYIFEWDGNHPDRSQALVTWAITHPGENIAKFKEQHPDWTELNDLMTTHRAGTEGFLKWIMAYNDAARALMLHSGALKWAGDHLYQTELNASK
jgi:hypothetical protein